jgi:hypothetical protein
MSDRVIDDMSHACTRARGGSDAHACWLWLLPAAHLQGTRRYH